MDESVAGMVLSESDHGHQALSDTISFTDVVFPEFEANQEMTRQALLHLRVPASEIRRHTEFCRTLRQLR